MEHNSSPALRNSVHDGTRVEPLPQRNHEVLRLSLSPSPAQTLLSVLTGAQERELERETSECPSERIQGDKVGDKVGGERLGSEREQGERRWPCPLSPFLGTTLPICRSGIHGQPYSTSLQTQMVASCRHV